MTIQDLLSFAKGTIEGELSPELKVSFISNDSRTKGENWVYLALQGERLDGHQFVEGAYQNGAIAAIVERNFEKGIIVKDSYRALKDIAIGYKKRYDIPCVGVTGSSGKTTTKDMIYFAISESWHTLRNEGNLNSEIGLPMTVLNLNSKHECCVLEMGMYHLGEIDYLAEIARPHVAVITNVGTAHILNLKTRENIRLAKMEITNYMNERDFLLINGDNDMLAALDKKDIVPEVFTFGLAQHNDIHPIRWEFVSGETRLAAKVLDEEVELILPTIGEHNVANALSALGVCKLLGLDLKKSATGLTKYQPSKHRMEKSEIGNKIIIDDSYNANPDSVRAALSTLDYVSGERKVAILADMLELGENSAQYHFEVGEFACHRVDVLIAIGEMAKHIIDGAKKSGMNEDCLYHFKDNEQTKARINDILQEKDAVIIKGSRGMKLEEVADSIC